MTGTTVDLTQHAEVVAALFAARAEKNAAAARLTAIDKVLRPLIGTADTVTVSGEVVLTNTAGPDKFDQPDEKALWAATAPVVRDKFRRTVKGRRSLRAIEAMRSHVDTAAATVARMAARDLDRSK